MEYSVCHSGSLLSNNHNKRAREEAGFRCLRLLCRDRGNMCVKQELFFASNLISRLQTKFNSLVIYIWSHMCYYSLTQSYNYMDHTLIPIQD